jgi:hypothetical protein
MHEQNFLLDGVETVMISISSERGRERVITSAQEDFDPTTHFANYDNATPLIRVEPPPNQACNVSPRDPFG